MTVQTVVIVGSGFYGILCANTLVKKTNYRVVLISPSDYTYFLISSIRVCVYNEPDGSLLPLREVVDENVRIEKGVVTQFDEKAVLLNDGREVVFDAMVIATGAKWLDPIGTTVDFQDEYSEYFERQRDAFEAAQHVVLIGGGFNNVELAGELLDKFGKDCQEGRKKITIIHSQPLLMPNDGLYCDSLRERITAHFKSTPIDLVLSARAQLSAPNTVKLNNGETIEADFVVQSTGTRALVPPNDIEELCNDSGFIRIDETFQCSAISQGHVFAIGDVTDINLKGLVERYSWVKTLCNNIDIVLKSKSLAQDTNRDQFQRVSKRYGHKTTFVSMGRHYGSGQLPTWFGTFVLPNWAVVWLKSRKLHIGTSTQKLVYKAPFW